MNTNQSKGVYNSPYHIDINVLLLLGCWFEFLQCYISWTAPENFRSLLWVQKNSERNRPCSSTTWKVDGAVLWRDQSSRHGQLCSDCLSLQNSRSLQFQTNKDESCSLEFESIRNLKGSEVSRSWNFRFLDPLKKIEIVNAVLHEGIFIYNNYHD